jgi:hypothetical protein
MSDVNRREVAVLAKILTDPQNQDRSAEEVAELCLAELADYVKKIRADEVDRIAKQVVESVEGEKAGGIPARIADRIDDMRSATHRIAVVGQIQYGPQEAPHTVVLGPFRARGTLDTEAKFLTAIQGGTAAREAGQHVAWDTKTGTGKGRFMLVPAFRAGRDAWDFYRGQGPAEDIAQVLPMIRSPHFGPVCACGLAKTEVCRWCGLTYERHCPLHDPEAEVHRCRPAA